ncbi:MAG: RNB domain-containing ribonuclease, partial [Synechococcaceae cyanobacterium RM1_1_27]|nr:RNB domain-containing ribonuclease [Synechococcaceae cyanobacterium RM1_1_27]
MPLDQLRAELEITSSEQQAELDLALEALQKMEFIDISEDQITCRQNQELVVGRLRCSSKGFCFAIRDEPGVEDIYIHGSNLHGAWNGDQVLAKVTKDGSRRRSPEGEVAAVIERANPTFVGSLKQTEAGFKILPLDDRLLFELKLDSEAGADSNGIPALQEGRFAYVEVLRYPLADQLPIGRIRKILGSNPETSMDIDLVCCRHDLPQTFPAAVLEAAGSLSSKISKSEIARRQDFRDWLTVTLDPKPLQDNRYPTLALSLGMTDDDGWQLGVHIADAAYWIPEQGPIEQEALARATAVFLDTATLPMLPPEVQALVGFRPQKETLTQSVLLELTADGSLISAEIHPGIITP